MTEREEYVPWKKFDPFRYRELLRIAEGHNTAHECLRRKALVLIDCFKTGEGRASSLDSWRPRLRV